MLVARPAQAPSSVLAIDGSPPDVGKAVWIDLIDPSDEERAQVHRLTGLDIPSRGDLDEIESSSRLFRRGDALYLSTPLTRRREGLTTATPLGIVASPRWLLTIRFNDYLAFDSFARTVETASTSFGAPALLLGLLEAIVDRLADVLEYVGGELDQLSANIFSDARGRQSSRHIDRRLRGLLRNVGRNGDTVSQVRDSLLGLTRMVLFINEAVKASDDSKLRTRLKTLERDLQSLSDYDNQVTNKIQFLLDATLGFISIEQNNGIRVVTVASIIGVTPTLVASIYGMNFKNIPELNWTYGYYYALSLMLLTVVLPLAWFRRIGWI